MKGKPRIGRADLVIVALLEEKSLLERAGSASKACRPLWARASKEAGRAVSALRKRQDDRAVRSILRTAAHWSAAADCEVKGR